jgi:serine/threonine-protein kinase
VANDASNRPDGEFSGLEGRVLAGRFRIANVLSAGANTMIADAFDERTTQPVTVKIVRPELADDVEFRSVFDRAARLAAAVTHPNVATVVDWGEVEIDGRPTVFWVVEYLSGGSLRDLSDRGRLLEPSQALVVGLEACRALDAAHQRGLIHSEVTPSKLVFGDDRRLRIIDFGMARLLGARAWDNPSSVPTHVARYASPEQALGMPIDAKSDVYALSLCLIEAVTGEVPFASDSTVSTLAARVGKLMPVSADLGSLAAVLGRAGLPEPEDRYTAAEFGRALVAAASKLPRPEPVPIVAAGLFDTSQMRRPTDPTGGIARPDTPDEDETTSGAADSPGAEDAAVVDVADADAAERPPATEEVTSEGRDPGAVVAAGVAGAAGLAAAGAATAGRSASPGGSGEGGDRPLIVMSDPAEPHTVAGDTLPAPTAPTPPIPPPAPSATQEMPIEATPAGAVTTTMPRAASPSTAVADDDTGGILYDDERRGRRWGKVILIVLLVLAGLAAASYAGYLLLRTKSYEVPDLVGVSEAVARNEVAGNGWDIVTLHERSDVQRVIGDVIATDPVAGVSLDEGETITFVISDGPELRPLPDVSGLPLAEAQAALEALELDWIVAEAEFDEEVPPGTVISWSVQNDASLTTGGPVLPGTVVILTPSMGPEPRSIPSLVNLTFEEASTELAARRLRIERTDDVFSDEFEPGRIVSQAPAPESMVERESVVTVTVSKGPDVVAFPADVVGKSYAEGSALLADSGFTIGAVLGTTEGTIQSVSIAGAPVGAGDIFRRGTAVDLVSL